MKIYNKFAALLLLACTSTLMACGHTFKQGKETSGDTTEPQITYANTKVIHLAGGCFWGMEKLAKALPGVVSTTVGYANGTEDTTPTYETVCSGGTGFKETVRIEYNPEEISLEQLISAFFLAIDPEAQNQQGNDRGTQYQSGIYYSDDESAAIVESIILQEQKRYKNLAVEHEALTRFYDAETYHQDYLEKNPAGYCHFSQGTIDRISAVIQAEQSYAKMSDEELKKELTDEQYNVTQNAGTEHPFTGEYWDAEGDGIYVDITSGQPLFSSADKYGSDCGWPSFTVPILAGSVNYNSDNSYNMNRTEVTSSNGSAHLGHVFEGYSESPNGVRYCINSASLKFIPKDEIAAQGYEAYLFLLP